MDGAFGLVSSGNGTSPITVFDIINLFRMTNCLACRYPKNDRLNHHMQNCNLLKEFGLTFTYDPATDQHRPKTRKHHKDKKRKEEKRKKDEKANEETPSAASNPTTTPAATSSIPTTSVQTGRKATNPFTTVGKNGGDAASEAEAKQAEANNLARQAKASQDEADALADAAETNTRTGSARKASARRGFNFDGRNADGDDGLFQFVDSHTAANDLKNDIDGYFHPIYSELEKLNRVDRNGVTQRCVGTCRMAGQSSFVDQPAKQQKARTQTNKHYKGKRRNYVPTAVRPHICSLMRVTSGTTTDDARMYLYTWVTAPVSLWLAMVLLVSN